MNLLETLPAVIRQAVEGKPYTGEDIGRSEASVLMFADMVLKIEPLRETAENEYRMLRWLEEKLPAPRVLAYAKENGKQYLLMTKLSGVMACAPEQNPADVVRALAKGLKRFWQIDISDCPIRWDIETKLKKAEKTAYYRENPTLHETLLRTKPTEDLVFSHGDYCLPNVFLSGDAPVGFLDLGSAGMADKWYDIMMCLWSIGYNFRDLGGMSESELSHYEALFFEELGISPDRERLAYHEKLDRFFA